MIRIIASPCEREAPVPLGVVGRVSSLSTMGGGRGWWSIDVEVVDGGGQASEDDASDAEGIAPRSSIFTFRGCACGMCGA